MSNQSDWSDAEQLEWSKGYNEGPAEGAARKRDEPIPVKSPDVRLEAPCVWCGYNGPDYWQSGTHAYECPCFKVGGMIAREEMLGVKHPKEPTPAKPEAPKQDRAQAISDEFAYGRPDLAEAIRAYGNECAGEEFRKHEDEVLEYDRDLTAAEAALAAEKERAERLSVAVDMKERTIKALTESVSVRRQTEERIKAEKRAEAAEAEGRAAKALVEDCEREHPPEPEYLEWQAAGKPDVAEVSRLREVLGEIKPFTEKQTGWGYIQIARLCREALGEADREKQ
jgi:hypothetical protein